MTLDDLLWPESVVIAMRGGSKRALLRELSRRAARHLGMQPDQILAALQAREALGSTGVGQGVALPHAKISGLERLFGLFARLERPIDFDAIDGKPVDLVFLLLAPERPGNESLTALAAAARQLRDPNVAERVRTAAGEAEIYQFLTGIEPPGRPGSSGSQAL